MLSRFAFIVSKQVPARVFVSQAGSNTLFQTYGKAPNVVIDHSTKEHILGFNREFRDNPVPITPGDKGVIFNSDHWAAYLAKKPEVVGLVSHLQTLDKELVELFWRRFSRTALACNWSDKQRFEGVLVFARHHEGLDLVKTSRALYQNPHCIDIKGLEDFFKELSKSDNGMAL